MKKSEMKLLKNRDQFLTESKDFKIIVPSDESPMGFYTIANALSPEEFFKELNNLSINYKHDRYSNFIQVFVPNVEMGSVVRELALGDILEADDIDDMHLPYMTTPDDINDNLEIKLI